MLEETAGLHAYIEARRRKVRTYVAVQFGFAEISRLHRSCFKRDLLVNLINSFIAIPLLAPKKIVFWIEKIGFELAEGLSARVPSGLTTRFHREMERSLLMDFFGSPGPFRKGTLFERRFQKILQQELRDFSIERASITDLLGSVLPIGVGYLLFRSTAYSAEDIGRRVASVVARNHAVSHFFLGRSAANVFYHWFPVHPTRNEILIATAITFLLFAMASILIHVLIDPLQNRLGVHERKLNRMLDSIEMKMLQEVHRELQKAAPGQAPAQATVAPSERS